MRSQEVLRSQAVPAWFDQRALSGPALSRRCAVPRRSPVLVPGGQGYHGAERAGCDRLLLGKAGGYSLHQAKRSPS